MSGRPRIHRNRRGLSAGLAVAGVIIAAVVVFWVVTIAYQAPVGPLGNTSALPLGTSLTTTLPANGSYYGESANFTTPTCKNLLGGSTGCGQGWSLTGQVAYGKSGASGQLCVVQVIGGGGVWCGTVNGGGSCTIIVCSTDIANIIPAIGKGPLITGGQGTFVLLFTSSAYGAQVSFPNGIQMVNAVYG